MRRPVTSARLVRSKAARASLTDGPEATVGGACHHEEQVCQPIQVRDHL
jgi:hypothetical protein